MSYVEKLRTLPNRVINILRRLESIQRKIVKCKWSLVFNNTCISENILPNYTNEFSSKNCKLKIFSYDSGPCHLVAKPPKIKVRKSTFNVIKLNLDRFNR